MSLGQTISWGPVEDLNLDAFNYSVPEADHRQRVRVYSVPTDVDAGGYFVAVSAPWDPVVAPPSKVKDTALLVEYDLDPDGTFQVKTMLPQIKRAMQVPY